MVVTRGKKKSSSSATTLEEQNKAAENGLPDTHSDSLTVDVIEPNEDAQLEDKLDLFSDNARKENFGEVPGEEGKKVTEVDNEDPSMSVTETNGDNKAELGENTFEDDEIDDQKDMLWEDDKEAFEHDSEDRVLDMYELNEEEAAYEDDEGDDVSEEEATEEDEASEEEATKEENDKENYQEKKENAEQDKRVAKVKEDGRKAKVKEDGREAKVKEDGREAKVHEDGREAKVKEDGREANKHESEASLKNIKNSNKRRRKKKLQTGGLMKVDSEDKPESSRKRKVKNRVQSMGMIFMCSSETKKDCYKYRVFGLPESKKDIVEKIYTGMRLFLYDFDLKLMYGIYKATGPGGYNIEPKAFKSQFPSQEAHTVRQVGNILKHQPPKGKLSLNIEKVRFKVKENCLPLPEEKFKKIIEENYFTKTKFDCQLNSEQVKKLCRLFSASSKGRPSKKLGMSLKAEKRPIHRERGRRQRTGDKRHLPLREEARCPERPRKSPRKAMSPAAPPRERFPPPLPSTIPSSYVYDRASDMDAYRQPRKRQRKAMSPAAPPRERFPPPLPSKIPSSYVYDRASDMDAYRRDPYLESRSPYRDRRDRPLIPVDPYGGVRAPPIEHSDRYRDGRDPPLVHHYAYSGGRDSHIERRDHYIDGVDSYSRRRDPYSDGREPHVEPRDPYRDGRDPYIESRESYRDGRHPYVERRDSFRDLRAPYLERHVPYGDSAHSELYSSYRRPPLSDSRVEFCDSYRRDELSGRHDQHQLHSDIMKHHVIAGRDAFVSSRERPSYADTLYPAAYPSRAGLYGL